MLASLLIYLETESLNDVTLKLNLWRKYVDDIFIFLHRIKFSLEMEENKKFTMSKNSVGKKEQYTTNIRYMYNPRITTDNTGLIHNSTKISSSSLYLYFRIFKNNETINSS